mgnify:FL=1
MNTGKGLKNIMPDTGIIKPLRQRIKDLEEINESHQNKNGKLRVEIQEKDKKIKELEAQKNNPLQKIREVGL